MLSLGSVDNFLWNYWNSYSVRPGFLSCFLASNLFDLPSLKLAVPLWKGTSSKGTDGLPTMIFQDRLRLVFGRVDVGTAGKLNKKHDFLKVIPGLCVFLVTVFVKKNIVERWSTNKTPSWKSCGKIQVQNHYQWKGFKPSLFRRSKADTLKHPTIYRVPIFESHTSTDHPVIMSNSAWPEHERMSKLKIHGWKMYFLLK